MTAAFLERRGDCLRLRIRLTPGARREEFGGMFEDAAGMAWLRASVRAVPEKGKANEALIAAVSKRCGIARGRITLSSGETARTKTLEISACSAAEEETLAQLGEG